MTDASKAAILAAVLMAGCGGRAAAPAVGELHGGVAKVGSTVVSLEAVEGAAARSGPGGRTQDSLGKLVEDALCAESARTAAAEGGGVAWESSALLAGQVAAHLRDDAIREGPPREDELSDVRVVHAVVLRAPGLDQGGETIARSIAEAVAKARDEDDFKARARGVPHGVAHVQIESLLPFDAEGNSGENARYQLTFVAASFELRTPGETTVVETPYGWHVIRLLERTLPAGDALERRRIEMASGVTELRVRQSIIRTLRARKAKTTVAIDTGAEGRMSEAFSRLR